MSYIMIDIEANGGLREVFEEKVKELENKE